MDGDEGKIQPDLGHLLIHITSLYVLCLEKGSFICPLCITLLIFELYQEPITRLYRENKGRKKTQCLRPRTLLTYILTSHRRKESLLSVKHTKHFIELANNYHPTIKFTAEISDTEITFLDTCVYKGERFKEESILNVRTYFKPTETFQYTHFTSCHPPGVRKGFIKGEALRLLRTNSSKATFKENITQFKRRLRDRCYPDNLVDKTLSKVKFSERMSALQNKQKAGKRVLPFVTEYRPSVSYLKNILMSKWHLIENQPLLRNIFKDPPLLSYRKGRSLKDVLVGAKL